MRHFRQHQQSRPKKKQLIVGYQAVIDALEGGIEIERIFVDERRENKSLLAAALAKGVPVNKVPDAKLKTFNVPDHGGVIALKSKIVYQDLQDVISMVVEAGEVPLFLLLDGITDIRNIGAVARTAYCCGVHALIIPQKGVGTLNEEAILTSAGALEHLPVCREKDLESAISLLKLNGISIWASEMTAEKQIFDVDMTVPAAIIMGSEDKGISPHLYKESDIIFRIPMKNGFESLNVSVATGMILYETMRQRTLN